MTTIWLHDIGSTGQTLEALRLAANCPLVTHVMVHAHHVADYSLWDQRAEDACLIARRAGKRLIWSRGIGPTDHPAGFSVDDLQWAIFYVEAIQRLREEGRMRGADAVALDMEPYSACPWKAYKYSKTAPVGDTLAGIHAAVVSALRMVGTVDYVWPAGSWTAGDWYQQLALLGENRITESTYPGLYSNWPKVPHPYEVVGLWINTVDRRPGGVYRDYVPVAELDQAIAAAGGRDVFLYPYRPDLPVAQALVAKVGAA